MKFFFLSFIFDYLNNLFPSKPHLRLVKMTNIVPGQAILDVCCGTGYLAKLMAHKEPGAKVCGIDLSKAMIEVGQKKTLPNLSLQVADAAKLPFEDKSFDLVTVAFGLHELPTEVRQKAVLEIKRVLKSTGQLVVVDLDRPLKWYGSIISFYLTLCEPIHAKEILHQGLTELLKKSGFSMVRTQSGLKGFLQYVFAA